jgi:hypothetical protein
MDAGSRDGALRGDTSGEAVWSNLDLRLLGALLFAATASVVVGMRWHATPVEDAAMLLRYAGNLAAGHGIRWNVDGAPVDGATDFLFMVATGLLSRVGHVSVVAAARILIAGSQILSVGLAFYCGRRVLGGNRWVCAAMAVYLIAGPAVRMGSACFGAPVFAAALLACWCALLMYARAARGREWNWAVFAAVLGLISGLVRPEGVLVSLMLAGAAAYLAGRGRTMPLVVSFACVYAVFGGAYFVWRWHYFGYPLPNPFYVKGGGHLYPASGLQAAKNLCELLFPVLPLIPLGWISRRTRPLAISLTVLLGSFTLMWVLLNNWNNHYMRFQYAIVPIVLATIPGLLVDLREAGMPEWNSLGLGVRRSLAVAALLATLGPVGYIYKKFDFVDTGFSMRLLAERLHPFAAGGHTMAVTEAGVLPLYSGWHVIDGLGLNDSYIAHHGAGAISDYFARERPEVIMVHLDAGPMPRAEVLAMLNGGQPVSGSTTEAFARMGIYAVQNGYTMAAAYGSSGCNLHIFWVRPGIADYDGIMHAIRDYPYYFLDNGILATDYRAGIAQSTANCAPE